ncbi:MAG TPA: 2-dehydropantoate 2-reductase [Candidatus Udaeobacter sp.]|jgi:2-dehydropantoate 2-reductase|nr:2-dehydropantoate 2-reductase [Candidatus Udaeobacter sp.]
MSEVRDCPRIAIVGAGAVGGYFGGTLARAGAPVVFIGRKHFVEAMTTQGLVLDKSEGEHRIEGMATTDMSAVRDCSLILFCVKANATSTAAAQMAPFVRPDATVVCLQNGVDNAERVHAATNLVAIPAVVYVAVSVPEPGRVKHLARGDLIIGPPVEKTTEVANVFNRAGISCLVSENIEGELWVKLLCNCALNAISALGRVRYGEILQDDNAKKLMENVVDEVLAVARAAGVVLPGVPDRQSGIAAAMEIATQMADAFSSTAQDLNRERVTEIDALNGYVARRGAELGVPVPANHALFTLVKLAERRYAMR